VPTATAAGLRTVRKPKVLGLVEGMQLDGVEGRMGSVFAFWQS